MITVQPASDSDTQIALAFLTQHLSAQEQKEQISAALSAAQCGDLCLDGLLLARRNNRPVGAILTILQPGGAASLWPPELAGDADVDEEVADTLVQTGINRLCAADVTILQSIVECEDTPGREILKRNGLRHLTDLVFMERNLKELQSPAVDSSLEYVTYHESTHDRFVELLRESYQQTCDCPELDGVRTAEQALAGHRSAGLIHPQSWRLFQCDGRDAGVLLISEHPAQQAWELVYMGVAPHARGAELGQRMLTLTLPALRSKAADKIFLAVDIRNHYAVSTYERMGFAVLATRALHLLLPQRGEPVEN